MTLTGKKVFLTALVAILYAQASYSLTLPITDSDSHDYGGERKANVRLSIDGERKARLDMSFENNYKYEQVRLYAGVLLLDEDGGLVKGCVNSHHLPAPRFDIFGSTSPTRRTTYCEFALTEEQARSAAAIRYEYSKEDYRQMYRNLDKAVELGIMIIGAGG